MDQDCGKENPSREADLRDEKVQTLKAWTRSIRNRLLGMLKRIGDGLRRHPVEISAIATAAFTMVLALTSIAMWSIANNTLAEMRETSRTQSEQFRDQLNVLKGQAAIADSTAKAAQRAADASVQALYADRAWVFITFAEMQGPNFIAGRGVAYNEVELRFLTPNHGLTPARIDAIEVTLFREDKLFNGVDLPSYTEFTQIDPDNPEHAKFAAGDILSISDKKSGVVLFDYDHMRDEDTPYRDKGIRSVVLGSGEWAEFEVSIRLLIAWPLDEWNNAAQNWLHIEMTYLDVYQKRRETCYFGRIDGSQDFVATHIQDGRHNFLR